MAYGSSIISWHQQQQQTRKQAAEYQQRSAATAHRARQHTRAAAQHGNKHISMSWRHGMAYIAGIAASSARIKRQTTRINSMA